MTEERTRAHASPSRESIEGSGRIAPAHQRLALARRGSFQSAIERGARQPDISLISEFCKGG